MLFVLIVAMTLGAALRVGSHLIVLPWRHFGRATGLGHFVDQAENLGGRHLTVVVMIEITVDAALVTAVGDVEVNRERNIEPVGLGGDHFQHTNHRLTAGKKADWGMGASEIGMIS